MGRAPVCAPGLSTLTSTDPRSVGAYFPFSNPDPNGKLLVRCRRHPPGSSDGPEHRPEQSTGTSRPLATFFSFPNPVNELAARTVAAGVVAMCVVALATRQGWPLIVDRLRVLGPVATGPKASPLGQLAVRRRRSAARPGTPGPRTPQAVRAGDRDGVQHGRARVLVRVRLAPRIVGPASACSGQQRSSSRARDLPRLHRFAALMRAGIIPESVCEESHACHAAASRSSHN